MVTDFNNINNNNKKRWGVQKTSVGLHSRGVITAIPVGDTSALPAGSPSGGVRVGAVANTTETDVQPGVEEDVFFFTFGLAEPTLPSAVECRARRGAENNRTLMVSGQDNNQNT